MEKLNKKFIKNNMIILLLTLSCMLIVMFLLSTIKADAEMQIDEIIENSSEITNNLNKQENDYDNNENYLLINYEKEYITSKQNFVVPFFINSNKNILNLIIK